MGTPMSCNFANLFMREVESNMLNEYETATGIRPFCGSDKKMMCFSFGLMMKNLY